MEACPCPYVQPCTCDYTFHNEPLFCLIDEEAKKCWPVLPCNIPINNIKSIWILPNPESPFTIYKGLLDDGQSFVSTPDGYLSSMAPFLPHPVEPIEYPQDTTEIPPPPTSGSSVLPPLFLKVLEIQARRDQAQPNPEHNKRGCPCQSEPDVPATRRRLSSCSQSQGWSERLTKEEGSSFTVGDLVWARVKGYPPWPGRITRPPKILKESSKKKHGSHCVFFFGTRNYSWVQEINLYKYCSSQNISIEEVKSPLIKQAVKEIEEYRIKNKK